MNRPWLLVGLALAGPPSVSAQDDRLRVGNVFPKMSVVAPSTSSGSEVGIGALVPWADRLWAIGCAPDRGGQSQGLYVVDEHMRFYRVGDSVTGTYGNRMVHWESQQAFIGPYAVRANGEVRTLHRMKEHRLAATARHLTRPDEKVYFLTMDGALFEVDVHSLAAAKLVDLAAELGLGEGEACFKGAHTSQGRLVVANDAELGGSLVEWDGSKWTVVERNAFVEVAGEQHPTAGVHADSALVATGRSRSAVILRVLHGGEWTRYLLPKASHSTAQPSATEWMRVRAARAGRYLMDVEGMFYELPAKLCGGRPCGIRPLAAHLRDVTDFCQYRGLFVMAGSRTDHASGQPQSGLWFGDIDELWGMGKPAGVGGPWWDTRVEAAQVSDPFLMNGFDEKVLHVTATGGEGDLAFDIEIDFRGDGSWQTYHTLAVPAGGYAHHVFPDGFAAHWVRLTSRAACRVTAHFMYN